MSDYICSIIIPAYNCADSIINCLNSLRLNYADRLEVIIIDDGSGDDTAEKVKEYIKAYDFCKFFSISHKGVSAARNYGIKNALGKYIFFMDSDDTVDREKFDNALKFCAENDLDLAVFDYETVKQGKTETVVSNIDHNVLIRKEQIQKEVFKKIFLSGSVGLINLWNKIYKKEIIEKFCVSFDEKSIYGEDLVFNVLYLQNTDKMMAFGEKFYKYNVNNSGCPSYKKVDYGYDLLKVHNVLCDINGKYLKFGEQSDFFLQYKLNFYRSLLAYLQNNFISSKGKKIFLRHPDVNNSIKIIRKNCFRQFGKKDRLILFLLQKRLLRFALFILSR